MFKGSFVALVTPMTESGDIDFDALNALVEWHIEQGTHGIVSVGTTGESATLSFAQHIAVIKATVKAIAGRCMCIAGSGANSTEEAIYLQDQMANLGIDGYLSVVPYYNKPQQAGLLAHFTALANAAKLPILLYNVPSRTVVDMSDEVVAKLAQHPMIVGVKDATGDLNRLQNLRNLCPDDFLILSGDDSTGAAFMTQGGDGIISVSANIVPKQMKLMCEAALSGNIDEALAIDAQIERLHSDLFIEANPVMPKWCLFKMGKIASPTLRLPLVLPELSSQSTIESTLRDYHLIS